MKKIYLYAIDGAALSIEADSQKEADKILMETVSNPVEWKLQTIL